MTVSHISFPLRVAAVLLVTAASLMPFAEGLAQEPVEQTPQQREAPTAQAGDLGTGLLS